MLFPDERSVALKQIGRILDEFLGCRYGLWLSSFSVRELLRNLCYFAVEACLIPRRRRRGRVGRAGMVADEGEMSGFEPLDSGLSCRRRRRGAGTERKRDHTDNNAARCGQRTKMLEHRWF